MIANDRAEFSVKLDIFPPKFLSKNSNFLIFISVISLWLPLVASWTTKKPGGNILEAKSWVSFSKKNVAFSRIFWRKFHEKKELWIKLHEIKTEFRTNKRTGHTLPPLASMANPRFENVTWVVRMPGTPCHQLPLTVLQT